MRRLPIRWKLTIWYAAFFSLAMVVLAAALYFGLRSRLYESLDEQVAVQVRLAQEAIRVENGTPVLRTDMTLLDDDAFDLLMAPDGEILALRGDELDDVPLALPDSVSDALRGRGSVATIQVDSEEPLRVRTMPVRFDDGVIGVLQAGLASEDVDETLSEVVSLLAIGVPVVLGFAVGGGYLLAGRVLAPVVTISRLASSIGERDLSARLKLDLSNDELGHLARTVDGMLDRIEDAFERQRRFTGDAAHELRTPLGLMRSQVDLALARPRSAEAYREALEELDTDLERMARLVGALLTLARTDARHLAIERASFDLGNTIDMVLEQFVSLADEAGVTLKSDTSLTTVLADEGLLIQVLVNLLENAFAHTPSGGQITAGCRMEREHVRLWVADTGSGVAPAHRERIFDRFYRVDAGRTREAGGTGLGLAIAKAIAEAHRGTISLVHQHGPGACVELLLPADSRPSVR